MRVTLSRVWTGLPRIDWSVFAGVALMALATFVFPFLALFLQSRGYSVERTGLLVALFGAGSIPAGPIGVVAGRPGAGRALERGHGALRARGGGSRETPIGVRLGLRLLQLVLCHRAPAAEQLQRQPGEPQDKVYGAEIDRRVP